ncbi:MAG: hypothetical protein U1A72_11030 [Sulfuritalea sp.]|nr:hypothetical protein [Sulfuritalea sp.]
MDHYLVKPFSATRNLGRRMAAIRQEYAAVQLAVEAARSGGEGTSA